MKNPIITILLLLLTVQLSHSQIRIGPKLGVNLANYTGSLVTTDRTLAGIQVGGLVEIQIIDLLSIQPELLYSVKGANFDTGKEVYNYVDVPIMAKIHPIEGLYGELGPQVGVLLSAVGKANDANIANSTFTQQIKTVDFALAFGAGYRIPDLGLGFGVRYAAGLSNFPKNNNRVKHGVFQLYTTWSFDL